MIEKVLNFFKFSKKAEDDCVNVLKNNINNLFESLNSDTIKILVGEDFTPLVNCLIENIGHLREIIKDEYGFIFPAVRILSDFELQENEIQFFINDKFIHKDFIIPTENYIETTFLDTFRNIILDNIDTIFTNNITEKYIDFVQKENSWMIWNLTNSLSIAEIKIILVDLIKNKKSINNINYIFEKICDDIFLENKSYPRNPHKISERLSISTKI
jgi:flagellar biosynthesis component FlhA